MSSPFNMLKNKSECPLAHQGKPEIHNVRLKRIRSVNFHVFLKANQTIIFLICLLLMSTGIFADEKQAAKKVDESLIIIASDAHVMEGQIKRANGYTADTTANSRNFVQDVLALDVRPGAIFLLGDNVDQPTVENINKFRETISPLFEAGIPIVIILGNHDIPSVYDKLWPEVRKDYIQNGFYARRYNTPLADFLFLETTDRASQDGYFSRITPEMRKWIDTELKKDASKPVFICGHHLVDFKKYNLSTELYPVLQGWIHGHLHQWYEKTNTPVKTLGVPSLGFMDWGKRPITGYVKMRIYNDHYTFTLITNDRSDDRNGTVFSWPIVKQEKAPK